MNTTDYARHWLAKCKREEAAAKGRIIFVTGMLILGVAQLILVAWFATHLQ